MSAVRRKIFIDYRRTIYHIATISISVNSGQIYYFPSQKITPGKSNSRELIGKEIHHISLAKKDGNRHIKDIFNRKYVSKRILPIQDIGYQVLMYEAIGNIMELPIGKADNLDVVLRVPEQCDMGVVLVISLISGRLIVDHRVSSKSVGEDDLISIASPFSLGYESDNADKIIQVSLRRGVNSLLCTNIRRIVIPDAIGIMRGDLNNTRSS